MEDGLGQVQMSEMTRAFVHVAWTGQTSSSPINHTLSGIHQTTKFGTTTLEKGTFPIRWKQANPGILSMHLQPRPWGVFGGKILGLSPSHYICSREFGVSWRDFPFYPLVSLKKLHALNRSNHIKITLLIPATATIVHSSNLLLKYDWLPTS